MKLNVKSLKDALGLFAVFSRKNFFRFKHLNLGINKKGSLKFPKKS